MQRLSSQHYAFTAVIYAGEGVAQFIFIGSDSVCETSYKDRGGKYQGQRGVTLPINRTKKKRQLNSCLLYL